MAHRGRSEHDAYVSQADPPPMAQYMIEDGDDDDDDDDEYMMMMTLMIMTIIHSTPFIHSAILFTIILPPHPPPRTEYHELTRIPFCSGLINIPSHVPESEPNLCNWGVVEYAGSVVGNVLVLISNHNIMKKHCGFCNVSCTFVAS